MGIALPGAIAASLIDPDRQVVAIMGDGGFLFNSQELETAKRLGVGFTVVIFNDDDYGMISWKQHLSRGQSVSTRITNAGRVLKKTVLELGGSDPYLVLEDATAVPIPTLDTTFPKLLLNLSLPPDVLLTFLSRSIA